MSASMQALESLGELAIEDDVALWDIHFPAILETDQRLFDSDKVNGCAVRCVLYHGNPCSAVVAPRLPNPGRWFVVVVNL